jgi:subtilisin family serine protease/subtilisin-like proprotein convertase family protein
MINGERRARSDAPYLGLSSVSIFMQRRIQIWVIVGLLLLVGGWCMWHWSGRNSSAAHPSAGETSDVTSAGSPLPTTSTQAATAGTNSIPPHLRKAVDYVIKNTTTPTEGLKGRDTVIDLENAMVDTTAPASLNIPEHLRAETEPGAFIVQARATIDEVFRARLNESGATPVSYIPNNAWLVQATEAQAQWLRGRAEVRTVIPYEPYFKLKASLLPMAVEQTPLPVGAFLNVVLFDGLRADTVRSLEALGARVVAEGPSPFGEVLTVQPRPGILVAVAKLPGVQLVERAYPREVLNDLSRVRLNVSTNTTDTLNYFGLTGANVMVAIVDSGVDATHPDLTGRVDADQPGISDMDTDGHGTHVAGTVAGSGAASVSTPLINVPGSVDAANYRGKAPGARVYALELGDTPVNGLEFDSYVQQQAARTNALISQNSWGYVGDNGYSIHSASYDAAVRDALPFVTGSQPVSFVFAAGNSGDAENDGEGGFAGSISSPGTGKNVVTVGSIEQLRNITNEVVTAGETNTPWATETDSANEVAAYSSRGNVGIGVEGLYGRFKPDVMAPGTFVISTRSAQWNEGAYYNTTNAFQFRFEDLELPVSDDLEVFTELAPPGAIAMSIAVANVSPAIDLPIYIKAGSAPTTGDVSGLNVVNIPPDLPLVPLEVYYYGILNPTNVPITYDIVTTFVVTNDLQDYFRVLKQLNDAIGPFYRYETGTSMAAPTVSGMLALMQEYYATRMGLTNSPALMKAMLINGARSVSTPPYDLQVSSPINHQGWGLANLPTSLPPSNTGAVTNGATSFTFYEQSAAGALVTGQSKTRTVALGASGTGRPLRFTLVWTDPPGNPAAGIKLVNDLDLIVTNLVSGEVYYGNDIPSGSDFTSVTPTNGPPSRDFVNNVENVYIADPAGTNTQFTVTVVGRRVNANAVTAHPDNIAQDYALVISSGNGEVTNSFTVTDVPVAAVGAFNLTIITNTIDNQLPLFNQTVGASSPLIPSPNALGPNGTGPVGITNQWRFYVATNYGGTNVNFTNAAFVIFQPPTLSVPRIGPWSTTNRLEDQISRPEADLDLYVSQDAGLTNLDAAALAGAWSSVGRGGTEVIALSNSAPGLVYYIGVKSEDYMGGQFSLFAVFSDIPFSQRDSEGNLIIRGLPVPNQIPDGDNANPGVSLVLGIATENDTIRKVTATNTITHEQMGDLFVNLSHNTDFAVLKNHSFGNGNLTQTFIYDDSGSGGTDSQRSDGPGSLENFVTGQAIGLWLLTTLDDSPTSTGRVENLTIKVEPQRVLDDGEVFTLGAFESGTTFVEVPAGATNLSISVTNVSGNIGQTPLPVELFVRRDLRPTFTQFDYHVTVPPPGGTNTLEIGVDDLPPLQPGIYYITIFNPNPVPQQVIVWARLDLDLDSIIPTVYASTNSIPILDDAVTTNTIHVDTNLVIAQVEAGVRINHPRVSDLALQLVSPKGTRVLLFENRGGTDPNGLGGDLPQPDPISFNATGDTNAFSTNINVIANSGTIRVNYDFQFIPDTLTVYGLATNLIFGPMELTNSGYVDFVYNEPTNILTFVINEAGSLPDTIWNFSITRPPAGFVHATFTEDTNKISNPQSLLKFVPPPFTVSNPGYVLTNRFTNGIYYLPEESLEVLKSERAGGDWTLEIWDSRVGAMAPGPELLSWQLEFILLKPEIPFIVLEPFVPTNSTVASSNWTYLVVDVPPWATAASNYLITASAPVQVWFNQSGIPTGVNVPPEVDLMGGAVTSGTNTIVVAGTPPLIPGQRYYLGIFNPSATAVTFTYQVDYDIITLTNGIPYVDVADPGGIPRYFAYHVTTNASAVEYQLFGMDGDLNLVASRGRLPTFFNNEFFSYNTGTNDESILVFTNGVPIALQPGRWFLGVYNATTNAVNYSIMATEFTNVFPQIIELTNGVPYANTNALLPGTSQFYHYRVTTNANRVQFEIFGATGDYTLVAVKGLPLPGLGVGMFDYRSANNGINDELIVVITNSVPVNLTSGDWFLAAVKISGGLTDYSIMATEWPQTARPVQITSAGISGTDYCLTWISVPGAHYYVQGFNGATWDTLSPTLTAFDFTTSWCTPLPTAPYVLFRVIEGIVLQPSTPLPTVITGFTVTPGLVTMTWFGPLDASFQVEWTPTLNPPNWLPAGPPLTTTDGTFLFTDNGTFTGTPPGAGSRYYRLIQLP